MSNSLKEIIDAIIQVDTKLGFYKVVKYIILLGLILALFNYKTVLRSGIEIINSIENELHNEKIELRDELLAELYPILSEFRSEVRADRILYFEYHNSKENLIGIPFKYMELVQQSPRYGVPLVNLENWSSIGTGSITSIYEDIKLGEIIHCHGEDDVKFEIRYPGVRELMVKNSGSKQQIYISIPGINYPIGMIILEWMREEDELSIGLISKISSQNYIPRINAMILSKRS